MTDREYIQRAIACARKGRFTCSPNPPVGAIIVKDKEIIAEGWHEKAGEAHAEIHALRAAGDAAKGSTVYVTLEPCSTHGRTPPCTSALIEAGVKRVVIGCMDSNPSHAGRAVEILSDAGIKADVLNDEECVRLIESFAYYITTQTPFIHAKWAMTLDGKIATRTGASRWISNEQSRAFVHELRAESDAVMVGIGTVLTDDPALTVRLQDVQRAPWKIIVDTECRTPCDAKVFRDNPEKVLICCADNADAARRIRLEEAGATCIAIPRGEDGVDLGEMRKRLGEKGITRILVEGGAGLLGGLLDGGYVQRVSVFIAPKIFGGTGAPTAVGGVGCAEPVDALFLSEQEVVQFGEDVMITGRTRSFADTYDYS